MVDAEMMCMRRKNQNQNHSTTQINDLFIELLVEIFIRLPSYKSIINCMLVCKRLSLLSNNPNFIVDFINHKKTLNKQNIAWTFLSTIGLKTQGGIQDHIFPTNNLFNSPKFQLKFLPFPFKVVSTFKDLILLRKNNTTYSICNPLTKQWVDLPPLSSSPDFGEDDNQHWVGFVCEDPYYDPTKGRICYHFRVIIVFHPTHHIKGDPYKIFNSMVFCSEDFKWKNASIKVCLNSSKSKNRVVIAERCVPTSLGLVCNGMVCLRYKQSYFGMFNPFDITPTSSARLVAKLLPADYRGHLFECGGRLISTVACSSMTTFELISTGNGKEIAIPTLYTMQLELSNVEDLRWRVIFRRRCTATGEEEGLLPVGLVRRVMGMHPTDKGCCICY